MSEEVPTPGDPGIPPAWDDDPWPEAAWPAPSEASWAEAPDRPVEPAPRGRVIGLRRGVAMAAAVGGLVLGSAVGGFLISRAATSTPVAAATTASGSDPSASPSPGPHSRGGFGGPGAFFGVNLVQDAATAIGVSEQTLQGDLQSGQTVAQVATAHGKTAQDVITALVGDETTAIDSLVSSGKLTSSQASQIKANLTQMVTDFVDQARPATVPGIGGAGSGEEAAIQAAATAIGVSASALQADLAAGQTIASVAQAHSVAAATVISAVTTAVDSQISSLESSGRITSAEATTLTTQAQSRVTAWVDGAYPGWPFGPFFGGFGGGTFAGMPWGHGPVASPSASASTSIS